MMQGIKLWRGSGLCAWSRGCKGLSHVEHLSVVLPPHIKRAQGKGGAWCTGGGMACCKQRRELSFGSRVPRAAFDTLQRIKCLKGMAINEDEFYKANSMDMSAELGSGDLRLPLSLFMEDDRQEASATSQIANELSSSLFKDVNSFVMDKEIPAQYVPAPAISAEVKGFIHAVWTLVFPEELQSTLNHPALSSLELVDSCSLQLNISGESKLEVDRIGQVVSIESKWYATNEGQEELDSVKVLLASLLLKEEHS